MRDHNPSIFVIDRQEYWRELAAQTLRASGYTVVTLATFEEAWSQHLDQQDSSLVLLGCTNVEVEERLLIARLLSYQQHVIVLATFLPAQIMRALFLRGVEDAADKTYDPADLVNLVEQALQRITSRKSSRLSPEKERYP